MAARPCRNSERLRQRLSVVYASATRAGSRVFHASSAIRTFCAAVSAVKGGSGGRLILRVLAWQFGKMGCAPCHERPREGHARAQHGTSVVSLFHSITSSASSRIKFGAVRPSAFAVL